MKRWMKVLLAVVAVLVVMGVPLTIESPPELRVRVRATGETLLRGAA